MALKIRMARGGAKKSPSFRIVVTDSRNARDGRFLEKVGSYNPMLAKDAEGRVALKVERIQHWLSVGAVPSDRVARFLDAAGMLKRTPSNNPEKAKPKAKAQERLEANAAAKVKAAEDAVAAEAAAVEAAAAAKVAAAEAEAAAAEAAAAPAEEAAPVEEVAAPAEEAAAPAEEAAEPVKEA